MRFSWLVILVAIQEGWAAAEIRLGAPKQEENRELRPSRARRPIDLITSQTTIDDSGTVVSLITSSNFTSCGSTLWESTLPMTCCNPDANMAGPACCGSVPWAGPDSGSVCCDGNGNGDSTADCLFDGIDVCPEACGTANLDRFIICVFDTGSISLYHEECKRYSDIKNLGAWDWIGGKQFLGMGCCSHTGWVKDAIESGAGYQSSPLCPEILAPQGGGGGGSYLTSAVELFARLTQDRCAERLPFGPSSRFQQITGSSANSFEHGEEAYFCTDCPHDAHGSDRWLQHVYVKGNGTNEAFADVFSIEWKFLYSKTIRERFENAYQNGEYVQWIVTESSTGTEHAINGIWYFSENFAYTNEAADSSRDAFYLAEGVTEGNGAAPGFGFSPDDGLWGAGACVDGSTGGENAPDWYEHCQTSTTDYVTPLVHFWGVGNLNYVDAHEEQGCGVVYRDGSKMTSPAPYAVKVEMYSN